MTTAPITLTDFLLARIAEDEAWARAAKITGSQTGSAAGFVRRVLAECEAKRRIVELHPIYHGDRIQAVDTSGTDFGCELCHRLDALHSDSLIEALGYCDTLLALASVYADHPEFRPEWKP